MKKLLPKSLANPSGFTLVELLIVIAIIAVLTTIGMAVYSGLQSKTRDARRKADINSVADAMETNYGKTTANQYNGLANNMFSSGSIPNDPINSGTSIYCVKEGSSAQTGAACIVSSTPVGNGEPTGGSTNTNWVVCANLEAGSYYCRGNAQ